MYKENVQELLESIGRHADAHGESAAKSIEESAADILQWAKFLIENKQTGVADELLRALYAAIRESAACLALGLIRPTLFSMRGQIDLVLSWIYFKDHPQEHALLLRTGENFKLKSEILKYIDLHYENFSHRFKLLQEIKTRQEDDPYRILSAHIHAQQDSAVPQIERLADIVSTRYIGDCIKIQEEVSEYLSDLLFSIFSPSYSTLPAAINTKIEGRCKSPAQRASLYTGASLKK